VQSSQSSPSKNGRKRRGGVTTYLADSGISQACSLPGLDTSVLAASLLSFSGGSTSLASSSMLVGARKLIRLQYLCGWNLVCGDDLKFSPTKWITQRSTQN